MPIIRALFARTLEGFFILLPVLIVYLMVRQLFDLLMALTTPITDVMPRTPFSNEWERRAASALLLRIGSALTATRRPGERSTRAPYPVLDDELVLTHLLLIRLGRHGFYLCAFLPSIATR